MYHKAGPGAMTQKKPGAKIGRPKTLPKDVEHVHAIMPKRLAIKLKRWAKEDKISRSELIRRILEDALRDHDPDE